MPDFCPTCGSRVRVVTGGEGTSHFVSEQGAPDPRAYCCTACGRLSHDPSGNCEHNAPEPLYVADAIEPSREQTRDALTWALNWIEYCAEIPIPGDEQEAWEEWEAARELAGLPVERAA